MLRRRGRLAVLAKDAHAHRPQAPTALEFSLVVAVSRRRLPFEPAAQVRMELVVERRMDVRSDSLVEPSCAVTAEEQVIATQRRTAHAELFAAPRHAFAVLHRQARDANGRLPVPPSLVVTAERAVVAIPSRDRPSVELRQKLRSDGLPPVCGVHRIPKRRELLHRNRVEADAVAGAADAVREGSEHRLLPLAVLALPLAVPDSECRVVRRGIAQRTVTEQAADDQLHLVLREGVLLDRDEDLVALLDLPRLPFPFRGE